MTVPAPRDLLLLRAEVKLASLASRARLLRERRRLQARGWSPPAVADLLRKPSVFEVVVASMRFLDTPRPVELVDVGANVGSWAARFRRYVPTARYVGIEPDPRAFAALEERFPGDELHRVAVGDTDDEAALRLADDTTYSSLGTYREFGSAGRLVEDEVTVSVRRLDTLLAGDASARRVVKIDVQGSEAAAVAGAGDLLRSVELLIVEAPLVPQTDSANDLGLLCGLLRPYDLLPVYLCRPGLDPRHYTIPVEYDVVFARDRAEAEWASVLR